MNISLYRRYRPGCFSEIVGQKLIKKILLNAIVNNRISHAYIFAGPHGVGKTSIARIFAKAINCLNLKNGDCCNECANCQIINSGNTSDIIELDAASNNGVNDVREMINNINYLPQFLSKKIYIIDEVQMLTINAWNALLKTIEDPPSHIIFIFATTEPSKILQTIISRCQKFDFHRISNIEIGEQLKVIAAKENYNISYDAIDLLSKVANGSLRDSLSMLYQLINSSSDEEINSNDVEILFGLTSIDTKIKILDLITKQDLLSLKELFHNLEWNGTNFLSLSKELLELIIDKIIYEQTKDLKHLKMLSQLNVDSVDIDVKNLYEMVDILQASHNEIKSNYDEKFFFEIGIWKCVALFNKNDIEEKLVHKKNIDNKDNGNFESNKQVESISDLNSIVSQENDKVIFDKGKEHIVELKEVLSIRKSEPKKEVNTDFYTIEKLEFGNNEKIDNKLEDSQILEIKEKFFQIAKNNKPNVKNEINKILEELKSNANLLPMGNYLIEANKALLASNNGIVFLFNHEIEAKNLNAFSENKEFASYIKEKFNKIYYVIGVSKEQARPFSLEFKELKNKEVLQDCDIEPIKKLLDNDKSMKELAEELFKKELG